MKISKDEIKHIAQLSALELSKEEIEKYSEQLSSILGYVEKLNKINTNNIKPLFQVTDLKNVSRGDLVSPSGIKMEVFLEISVNKQGDFFSTEKIFE